MESLHAALQAVRDTRRERRRNEMKATLARWGSYAALPFVLLAMLVVPLLGGHFCPQEALPVLAAAGSLPFIGPAVKRWRTRKDAHHCCEPEHRGVSKLLDAVKADGFFATAGRKVGPPLPDIDVDPKPKFKPIECDDPFCAIESPHRNEDHSS